LPPRASWSRKGSSKKEAVDSAQQSLQIFTNRYTGGVDTYLQVITARLSP